MNASVLWVDSESGRAELAHGLVLLDVARPVLRAGVVLARIAALEVDAGHVGRAAAVAQADGHRRGAVLDAQANRLVVEHLALLV